jgi:hypothetical protein
VVGTCYPLVAYQLGVTAHVLILFQRKSTDRQYPADPLIFNIARAVLSYNAYRETVNMALAPSAWGPFSEYAVARVGNNVPGGYYGLQIGSLVGILVSLYDAALKK